MGELAGKKTGTNKMNLSPINNRLQGRPIDNVDMDVIVDPNAKTEGSGDIEFYPPDERDNPNKGRPTMVILNKQNWDKMTKEEQDRAIVGEKLHYMPKVDKKFSEMRKGFEGMMTDEQWDFEKKHYDKLVKEGKESRPFKQWWEVSRLDAYIRGYLAPDRNDEWRKSGAYTGKQKIHLEEMKKYINGEY